MYEFPNSVLEYLQTRGYLFQMYEFPNSVLEYLQTRGYLF